VLQRVPILGVLPWAAKGYFHRSRCFHKGTLTATEEHFFG
jgi:hypothetical protein